MSVLQARLFGVPGLFRPRLSSFTSARFSSLYDLAPLRARVEKFVDFERVNGGDIRVCVATTDIESGDPVVFDTAKGDRIGIDHLLASCGFLPEFAPIEIGDRVLGDGALSVNAPLETVLRDSADEERIVFILDLYARDGARPGDFEAAAARKNDLLFGNQTYQRLDALWRENQLRAEITRLMARLPPELKNELSAEAGRAGGRRTVFYLSYRAPPEEAGPEKPFDLSRSTVEDRWKIGALDMGEALCRLADTSLREDTLTIIRRSS
jgi:NTE family protein